jgi:hypothetical protein
MDLFFCIAADEDIASAPRQPSERSAYRSTWNRQGLAKSTLPNVIQYEQLKFKKTICNIEVNGETQLEEKTEEDDIEVPKGWLKYVKGSVPEGGYLGKGMHKYAVKVRPFYFIDLNAF